ncbi:MAG: NADH dehydrogenase ubiquinone Fe-S protein 4, partial [Holosporales bacterium]
MQVRIYQPAKTAMQSGLAKTKQWLLEPLSQTRQEPDALMGWNGGTPTTTQLRLSFPSKEAAIAYAAAHNLTYT